MAVERHVIGKAFVVERGGGEHGIDAVQALFGLGQHHARRAALGSQPGEQALQRAAQLDGVRDVALGKRLHHVAAVGQRLQQALLFQAHQGSADRRARNTEALHDGEFGDARTSRQLAREDEFAQLQQRADLGAFGGGVDGLR
ncbi:hypothetical protein FQZ97_923640 [compost metagenome]